MDLPTFIKTHRPAIETSINTFLGSKKSYSPLPEMGSSLANIQACVTGGKMLRGILVVLGGNLFGKSLHDTLYQAAAAMELLQTGLIIHDDIMDNDLKRRGGEAVFYTYMKEGKQKNSWDFIRYGQSMGICVGDMSFFLATELLANHIDEGKKLQQILKLVSQELQHIQAAQMADAAHGLTSQEPDEEEIIHKYIYKTARYTFSLPLAVGAILAGQNDVNKLMQLGEKLGIVFQLKDDMLGIFGTEKEIGKPVGSDIRENKKTLIRQLLFQKASNAHKLALNALFGRNHISTNDVEMVRTIIKTYGIDTIIEQKISTYSATIETMIHDLKKDGADADLLTSLAQYNSIRSK